MSGRRLQQNFNLSYLPCCRWCSCCLGKVSGHDPNRELCLISWDNNLGKGEKRRRDDLMDCLI